MTGKSLSNNEITPELIAEMLSVGVVPMARPKNLGMVQEVGGRRIIVGEEVGRPEFIAAVTKAGFPVVLFLLCPPNYRFFRISEVPNPPGEAA